jgi:transposase
MISRARAWARLCQERSRTVHLFGQLWAYARDDRPWGGTDPPGVVYIYAPDRKAERPISHLAGFKGVLQVDGYSGYRVLAERSDVQLAFCWSHVRRRFYELAAAGPAPIASETLERIAGLYAIEKEIRGRSADERRAMRQDRSRPIIDDLEPWLRAKLALISQKSKLAEAIRYALSRWAGLTRFLDDGRIEIDSNVVERSTVWFIRVTSRSQAFWKRYVGLFSHPVLSTLVRWRRSLRSADRASTHLPQIS